MTFEGKNALVLGNGTSGKGAAKALGRAGARVMTVETDGLPPCVEESDLIVVSPGIPETHPVLAYAALHDIPVLGEIGLGAYFNAAPVIAVTGTNGKTSTVMMLGDIYRAAGVDACVCGNIGTSFADRVSERAYARVILELSSFQLLHAAPLRAHVACITNLACDHLDRHGSMLEYRHAKLRIADGQTENDCLIVPDELSLTGLRGRPRIYRRRDVAKVEGGGLWVFGERVADIANLRVKGAHDLENAGNAAAVAYADGIAPSAIRAGLSAFVPAPHRIAPVGEVGGTSFFDDSKGTNPAATLAALRSMTGSTALIAGGSDKGMDYVPLFRDMPNGVRAVFVTGANAEKMTAAARACGFADIRECDTLGEAVRRAAAGGFDNVLFSPASASFDRYSDYKERGDAFQREVRKLFSTEGA